MFIFVLYLCCVYCLLYYVCVLFYIKINHPICVAAPSASRDKADTQRRIVVTSPIIYMHISINRD